MDAPGTGSAYSFRSRWTLAADRQRCWHELSRLLLAADTAWWPGVRIEAAPVALAAGERLRMTVRSPLGYRLRIALTIDDVVPGSALAASSRGDLQGSGRMELHDDGAGTAVAFSWDVITRVRWMNATAPFLRPAFVAAHSAVMSRGERGLRDRVRGSG